MGAPFSERRNQEKTLYWSSSVVPFAVIATDSPIFTLPFNFPIPVSGLTWCFFQTSQHENWPLDVDTVDKNMKHRGSIRRCRWQSLPKKCCLTSMVTSRSPQCTATLAAGTGKRCSDFTSTWWFLDLVTVNFWQHRGHKDFCKYLWFWFQRWVQGWTLDRWL